MSDLVETVAFTGFRIWVSKGYLPPSAPRCAVVPRHGMVDWAFAWLDRGGYIAQN